MSNVSYADRGVGKKLSFGGIFGSGRNLEFDLGIPGGNAPLHILTSFAEKEDFAKTIFTGDLFCRLTVRSIVKRVRFGKALAPGK